MSILYESTTTSEWVEIFTLLAPLLTFLVGLLVVGCILTIDERWTKWCTLCVIIFLVSIALVLLVKWCAPTYRYFRVDASTITNWDEVIQKYNVGNINGKILNLIEKNPID